MNKHDATIYLKGIKDFYALDKDSEEAIDMAIEALSAERTGEWKSEGDCGIMRCNQCGWSIEEYIEWNYCPNCGAKMKGGTENE